MTSEPIDAAGGSGPALIVTTIEIRHPQGYGGHEFEYQPSDDLFRCVHCHRYEIVLRDRETGEIGPCTPTSTPTRVKVIGGLYNGKIPDGAVYVGRAHPGLKQSPFANPWCIKPPGHVPYDQDPSRSEYVVRHHRDTSRIAGGFPTREAAARAAVNMFRAHLDAKLRARAVAELRGKDLACWCKPGDPCHGDVLIEIANTGGES